MLINRKYYLKQFLNWFWLRPENAILLPLRAEKYARTLDKFDHSDSLDLSCGDGVFSFIVTGGQLSDESDMFRAIDNSVARRGNFDAFDSYDDDYGVKVIKGSDYVYKAGTDWKQNLLSKARHLSYYGGLILHDNNNKLPFNTDSYGYVYSNSAYWVDRLEFHLGEMARITKPGGHIVLEMKTSNIKNYSAVNYAKKMFGDQFCEIVDGGRLSTWRGLKTLEDYQAIIEKIPNIEIVGIAPVYGDMLAYIWDCGLRPLFNPLSKLANEVSPATRLEAKREWCSILYGMFEEVVEQYEATTDGAIEWIFTLRKI
jgi:SAM-dependent methyltransferase